jgi:HEAT repeat protein
MLKPQRVRVSFLCLAIVLIFLCAGNAFAQDRRTLATKIADILAQFPAPSAAQRDRLANEMLSLGEAGIVEISRQLVSAGSGNDTAARFALNCMAAYASSFGEESKRALAEKTLIAGLAAATSPEVKTFLLSQLNLVGREDAVASAAPYLLDMDLFEPAAQLMLSVRGASARRQLLAALSRAGGANQITLVKALGELKTEEGNSAILALANASTLPLRKVVLAALAQIASRDSYGALTAAAKKASYGYDLADGTGALLAYARNLGEKGDLATCEKICRLIIKSCKDSKNLPNGAAALGILAQMRGFEALPDLLKAVDHENKAYRNAVLGYAEKIRDVAATRQWIAKAQRARPELKAEIIAMLGRQGEARALPFIRASLKSSEPGVGLAAAEVLAGMQGLDALADLLPMLATWQGGELRRLSEILLWIMDELHLDPLVSMLDSLPPAQKACAIGIIAAKGSARHAARIFSLTADPNAEIRTAAFAALKFLAAPGDLPFLLRLLSDARDAAPAKEVQLALVRAANRIEPAGNRARPLLEALKAMPRPEWILEVLPQIGGSEALGTVIEQFDQADPSRRDAAFRALVQWKDPEAAQRLFAICSSGDAKYREEAFHGFVRLISSSALPGDQKLLQYRRIMPLAARPAERRSVIRAMESIKTFSSLIAVARYLDSPEIANDAAGIAMRIALPSSSGSRDGLSGRLVREVLSKALQILSGPESDYNKENIRSYLASMPKDEGFVPLFNGRDLSGWKGLVENPIARSKMTPAELAAKQAEADKKMHSNWSVRDGMIVFNGSGDNLCTEKEYGDFELLGDWRITKDGDSGIYLRGSPQVQIWDPARTDVGAQVGSGGLYNNQNNPSKPLVRADNPVGEWNTLRITMIRERVTVYLNGVKVVDNVVMENYWDRKLPIFPTGAIELQAHGTDLTFRDIYVREVSEKEYGLTEEERAGGFISLFNGKDLNGWVGNLAGYLVADGVMTYQPAQGNRGNLYTDRDYSDFQFRFEFQLTPGSNSGVGIRAPLEGDAAYVGMEIQVLDDTAPVYATLQPYQYHGSVYGVIPCKRGFLKPAGEWNAEEIIARGSRIQVILNGTVIVDGDILEASKNGTMDHQQHPGLQRAAGRIGWLSHDSVVRFRNVRILDLAPRNQ